MNSKLIALSLGGLIGIGTFVSTITQSLTAPNPPQTIPKIYADQILNNMASALSDNPNKFKITQTDVTIWADCRPDKSGKIVEPCTKFAQKGWRVKVRGKGENWVYFVTDKGFVTLDAPASISYKAKLAVAKKLNIQPQNLGIQAAQLTFPPEVCLVAKPCPVQHKLSWRILLNSDPSKIFHVDLQGNNPYISNSLFANNSGIIPQEIGEAVMRDVVNREQRPISNLNVESLKATTWNWCRGKGPGPTAPDMGACPDVDQSGWQMIVPSASARFIYYIQKTLSGDYMFAADGVQSLPQLAATKVKKDAAKRAKVSINDINVRFVEPRFFDGCLNTDNQKLYCRQSVIGGWQVTALGGQSSDNSPPFSTIPTIAAWVYNVTTSGDDLRFVQASTWMPKP
ncbi:hypothetical protein NIES2100_04540 [Calothrix sp. NIES-2100]|uniref:hypothetical protein n=1 Tax=Calothrix sp. NIES-2100 TaxID=1954172 RepID=UPI000B602C8D|nr:hypothetical protein NIES2100_04540 [Calothrix sp. NIES-2100]